MGERISTSSASDKGVAILARAIMPANGEMLAETAQALLRIRLDSTDGARVNELAARARVGLLNGADRAELDEYEHVAGLLEVLQSKARLALRRDVSGGGMR